MDQDETWRGGRLQPRLHCIRWGPSSPQKGHSPHPQFSAHVCYDQTAEWIKMPLGMENNGGHIALDGDPAPPQKVRRSPIFGPLSVVAK